jgi:glycine cleavage system aminomethyltransferase T/bacterioferritin-associated ferredoxin
VTFIYEGRSVPFRDGESVLIALLKAGLHPTGGGCLCLAGDCPYCIATVDGVSYVRTCQVPAATGMVVIPHPRGGEPPLPENGRHDDVRVESVFCDIVVVGQGESGVAAADAATAAGRRVVTLEARRGEEAIGIYAGPIVVARTRTGMLHIHCQEVVVATGAVEEQPVVPGSHLAGIVTSRAAALLQEAGLDLGQVVTVTSDRRPLRFEGSDRVEAVVFDDGTTEECDTVVADFGLHPRNALARIGHGLNVSVVGDAASTSTLPPPPVAGIVCPCAGVSVEDLESVWRRGFQEMELLKRATLAGTGTCQGAVCLPHLRSFMADHGGEVPAPFTARPVTRQLTMSETAAGFDLSPFRRTGLHEDHVRLGATMDRFGGWWRPWRYPDVEAEYWAVRRAVSLGDVGTLGKMVVSGPDAVELLERLYPCRVADLKPGRTRYALLLDERGYVIDDGLICRDSDTRFFLTFTSGGASFAEMWVRDWSESWGLDVRILDRTMALGAINVTGPLASELLARAGVDSPPAYMTHRLSEVSGVPCRIVRLSFTGEASFELHHPTDLSSDLWGALMDLGGDMGVYPHGLDVLFNLRLEKGHFIVGMDSEYDSTPRRLDLEWAVKLDKPDFVGKQAIIRTNRIPLDKRLVGWEMDGPAPAEGAVLFKDEVPIGQVTSARFSRILEKTVMLGWARLVDGETPEEAMCDGRPARHVPHPFYDREGARARG